jgi:hypothetical protein
VGQKYDIGKVRGDNVAIGDHAKAEYVSHTGPKPAGKQAEALNQIRQLIELLDVHSHEIDGPDALVTDAESIEGALQSENPDRSRIQRLIANMAPAVAGVTALSKAIDAIHATVSHL